MEKKRKLFLFELSFFKIKNIYSPVCAANIACEHGSVLCTVKNDYFRRLVSVPPSTWKVIVEKYGAVVPIPTDSKICEKCTLTYENLWKRREQEESDIAKLDRKDSSEHGWYLISTNWLKKRLSFVENDVGSVGRGDWLGAMPPGPITNDTLLESDGKPKKNLKKATHYRGVNKFVWDYLVNIYGGGPVICRNTIDIYDETPVESLSNGAHANNKQSQQQQQTKL